MEIKDIILNSLTMKQVLDYYDIEMNRSQFKCPFHGDKTPSAKSYENSYYCFACGSNGDLIQFVQNYFNLKFMDAIKKINYDFSLGINFEISDKKEFEESKKIIEERKRKRIEEEKRYNNKMLKICKDIFELNTCINALKNNINPLEWEKNIEEINYIEKELEFKEIEFEQNLR